MNSISWIMAKMPVRSGASGNYSSSLLRQRLAAGLRGEPDDGHADQIDQGDKRAGQGPAVRQRQGPQVPVGRKDLQQIAQLQDAYRGENAAIVEPEPLPRGPHARAKQLGQIERQPAVE